MRERVLRHNYFVKDSAFNDGYMHAGVEGLGAYAIHNANPIYAAATICGSTPDGDVFCTQTFDPGELTGLILDAGEESSFITENHRNWIRVARIGHFPMGIANIVRPSRWI